MKQAGNLFKEGLKQKLTLNTKLCLSIKRGEINTKGIKTQEILFFLLGNRVGTKEYFQWSILQKHDCVDTEPMLFLSNKTK